MYGVIYKLTNTINDKSYVGKTTRTPEQRFKEHARCRKSVIGTAIRKYGKENFTIEVLEECHTPEQINEREKFWIAECNCKAPNGYNRTDGGDGSSGRLDSPETKARKSAAQMGKKLTDEHRAKIGASNKGKHPTAETRAKMVAAHTGEKHHSFGKHFSSEHCAKISAAQRGKTFYKNLLNEINERNFSYRALDKLLHLSPQSFSHKMRGERNFTAKDIAKLVEIFNKPAEYLMVRCDGLPVIISAAERSIKIAESKRQNTSFKNLVCEINNRQLTYNALAKLIGLSSSTFSYKMRGKLRFTAKDIAKLVKIFNKPAEYLMARND